MILGKWFVLAALLALTACAGLPPPEGAVAVTPQVGQSFFITHDGIRLPLRHWDAEGKPRAILIALHGMNDYSNAFDGAARAWSKQGIATYAYDQRGFGEGPNPGSWPGSETLRQDFRDFAAALKRQYPATPLFALGESMGGAVLLTALADAPDDLPKLDGVILESPAVWSRSDMPFSYRAVLFLADHFLPGMTLTGNGLHIVVSDNIPMLRALAADPYVIKGTRVAAVAGLVDLMDEAHQAAFHLSHPPPLLFLYGEKDQIIPRKPTEEVVAALAGKAAIKAYPRGYHMLLRDLDGAAVTKDVADWIGQRLAGSTVISAGENAEQAMDKDSKKPDLRDRAGVETTITNTDSRMAGGDDRPDSVKIKSDFNEVAPDIGTHVPAGQVTKSN
jgi:alpha-beta hydrolase superfamily lysophospholipase